MRASAGFILIEVLIATVLAAIVSGMLVNTLYQATRFQKKIDSTVTLHSQAVMIGNQFERDIMGAFIPDFFDTTTTGTGQTAQTTPKKNLTEKLFFGNKKDNDLEELTFITNNPMQIFWGEKTGKAKPRIARVVYRLEPNKETEKNYVLTRQEGDELSYDAYRKNVDKSIRAYPLSSAIKALRVNYSYTEVEDEKKPEEKKNVTLSEWLDQKSEPGKADVQESKRPVLPEYVDITMVLADEQQKQELEFLYTIPIIAKKDAPKKMQPPKVQQSNQTKPGPNTGSQSS